MIQEFVDRFMAAKESIRALFASSEPGCYKNIVKAVVEAIGNKDEYSQLDPSRIVEIDHGDYQGTFLYVIGANGYQPSTYWFVKVDYGSCSGCDTLQNIESDYGEENLQKRLDGYMTLALHVVQGIKEIGGD